MSLEYNTVVTAIEMLSTEKLTLAFVKNQLLDEESKRKDGGRSDLSSVAFSSQELNRKPLIKNI